MYVDVAASGAYDKPKKAWRICRDRGKTVPTSVVDVIKLCRRSIGTQRDNAKFVGRAYGLEKKVENVWSKERLDYANLKLESACKKTLEAQVKDADTK